MGLVFILVKVFYRCAYWSNINMVLWFTIELNFCRFRSQWKIRACKASIYLYSAVGKSQWSQRHRYTPSLYTPLFRSQSNWKARESLHRFNCSIIFLFVNLLQRTSLPNDRYCHCHCHGGAACVRSCVCDYMIATDNGEFNDRSNARCNQDTCTFRQRRK